MALLIGTAFALGVFYLFGKTLLSMDSFGDAVAYIAGIVFVVWALGAIFG